MKVAFGTDERTPLSDAVRADLESRGHTVIAVDDGQWVEVGHAVGQAVADGRADTGVLFCWTGTGASIAANKVPGVRAALAEQQLVSNFLQPNGVIVNTCGTGPCYAGTWTGP